MGARRREFDANELLALSQAFEKPIAWFFTPPPDGELERVFCGEPLEVSRTVGRGGLLAAMNPVGSEHAATLHYIATLLETGGEPAKPAGELGIGGWVGEGGRREGGERLLRPQASEPGTRGRVAPATAGSATAPRRTRRGCGRSATAPRSGGRTTTSPRRRGGAPTRRARYGGGNGGLRPGSRSRRRRRHGSRRPRQAKCSAATAGPMRPRRCAATGATSRRTFFPSSADCASATSPPTIFNSLQTGSWVPASRAPRCETSFIPCQAIYRRHRRQVLTDPTDGLDLPEAGGRRKRVATPAEAALLIAAAPDEHRAVWATAAYAGLRRGELRAHRVRAIGESALSVEHSWDDVEGEKGPKSAAGIRQMPLPEVLRAILAVHVELTGRSGDELTFGRSDSQPFTPSHVRMRANRAWAAAGLDRIGLHELRHSYSTFLDAAGISETRSDRYMGHANPRWRTATATRSPDSLPRTRHGWTPISPARASGR
jgi:hypothetical protein